MGGLDDVSCELEMGLDNLLVGRPLLPFSVAIHIHAQLQPSRFASPKGLSRLTR